jgi:integrase
MPRVKLTQTAVDKAKHSGLQPAFLWDHTLPGFGLAVYGSGTKRFIIQYRAQGSRRSHRMVIGSAARLNLDVARKRARELLGKVDLGGDPLGEQRRQSTFRQLADAYFIREASKLRTVAKRRAVLERQVFPAIGDMSVDDIKRSHIIALLDTIEDESGPVAANLALAFVRRILSWHESRHDDYRSPIAKGMGRESKGSRDRVLTDDEIRAIWKVDGFWGDFGKLLLLTAARRTELGGMFWDEVKDGVWTIPAARVKTGKEVALPLSRSAMAILDQRPRLDDCNAVFTLDGIGPTKSYGDGKKTIDVASGVAGWRFHDLRRTARTLLSRAGVDSDTAERCLGHAIGGVRGVYDRHKYEDQMRVAFEKLADMIDQIVDPAKEKVIQLPA